MPVANKPAIIGAGQNFAGQLGIQCDSVSDDGYGIVLMPAGIPVDVAIVQSVAAGSWTALSSPAATTAASRSAQAMPNFPIS
jgi:hypothetical protein